MLQGQNSQVPNSTTITSNAPQISVEQAINQLVSDFFSLHPIGAVIEMLTSMQTDHVCKEGEGENYSDFYYGHEYIKSVSFKNSQLMTMLVSISSLQNEKK